ncbi:MAG: hypothetical protein ACRDJG_11105, partial [Actinomycetota bacterium]
LDGAPRRTLGVASFDEWETRQLGSAQFLLMILEPLQRKRDLSAIAAVAAGTPAAPVVGVVLATATGAAAGAAAGAVRAGSAVVVFNLLITVMGLHVH